MTRETLVVDILEKLEQRLNNNRIALEGIGAEGSVDAFIVYNARGPVYYKYDQDQKAGIVAPSDATQFTSFKDAKAYALRTLNGAGEHGRVTQLSSALRADITLQELVLREIKEANPED